MFRRNTFTLCAVWVALGLWVLLMPSTRAHARPIRLLEFLSRTAPLSGNELQALMAGRAVTREFPSSPNNELSLFGGVRVDVPLNAYLAGQHNPLPFGKQTVQAWGWFHVPPEEEDLRDLSWPAQDLEDLPGCRSGSSRIKLPPGYMEQLQRIKHDQPAFADRANALLRRCLRDYIDSYRRRGNAALM